MGFLEEFKSVSNGEKTQRDRDIEKGREHFRQYCNLINSDFFKEERTYQTIVCDTLQKMYERKIINNKTNKPYDILILNLPPGFGKSYTASLFATWVLGKNNKNQVITISYGQDLAISFSKTVRNTIQLEEYHDFVPVSFFPELKIKEGDGAADKWALKNAYMSYLGTSFTGKLTGMRGNIIIVDDPIKNAEEAVNEKVKQGHFDFYKNTLTSRMLPNALQIIIQTRWATDDLAGKIITEYTERCYVLQLAVLDKYDKSICESLYPTEDLIRKKETLDKTIWLANYMQQPIDIKGALYGKFKTYDVIDSDLFEKQIAYIDTADEGSDYLCAVIGGVIGRYGYITGIYYTDKPMEITEPETARLLSLLQTRDCLIESNNGGRSFARNVERELKKLKYRKCNITWFHQNKNKNTRILVNATNVMEQVILPEGWEKKYKAFYKAISTYQRKGKNAHDDAPDALTGFVEMINGDVKGRMKPVASPMKAFKLF